MLKKSTILILFLVIGSALLIAGCSNTAVDRGAVFSAVEMTLGLPDESNPVKDDLIKRGLFTIPSGNITPGQIKIGEIEQLVEEGIYVIDKDGYLQFGPSYSQQPVEVISVTLVSPPNPGGPTVKITLKNAGKEPVISLYATLKLERAYEYACDVTDSNPLFVGETTSKTLNLIGPGSGISSDAFYPLEIRATLKSGDTIIYTKQVKINWPPVNE